MAVIPAYQAKKGLDTARSTIPRVPVNDHVGRALKGLGGTLQGLGARAQAEQERQENFDAQARFIRHAQDEEREIEGQLNETGLDAGAQHDAHVAQSQERYAEFRESLPDRLKGQYDVQHERHRSRVSSSVAANDRKRLSDYQARELSNQSDLLLQGIANDPASHKSAVDAYNRALDQSSLLDTQKADLRKRFGNEAIIARAKHDEGYRRQLIGDPNAASATVINNIIGIESGGNPRAKNPRSSATGLAQFIDSTWMATVRKHAPELMRGRTKREVLNLRFDAAISRRMLERFTQDNTKSLLANGIKATPGNIYLAHFLGVNGAIKGLSADPRRTVVDVFGGKMVSANPFLKGKSIGWMTNWAAKKMGGAPSKPVGYNAQQRLDNVLKANQQAAASSAKEKRSWAFADMQVSLGRGELTQEHINEAREAGTITASQFSQVQRGLDRDTFSRVHHEEEDTRKRGVNNLQLQIELGEFDAKEILEAGRKLNWTPQEEKTTKSKLIDAEQSRSEQQAKLDLSEAILSGERLADPHNKDHRAAVDAGYQANILPLIANPETQAEGLALQQKLVANSKIIPTPLKGMISAAVNNGTSEQIKQIAGLMGLLPQEALDQIPKDERRVAQLVEKNLAYMEPEKALQFARQQVYDANDPVLEARRVALKGLFKDKKESPLIEFEEALDLDGGFFWGAAIDEGGTSQGSVLEMKSGFKRLYEGEFLATGDKDIAHKFATESIKRTWQETSVGSRTRAYQKHAPEYSYPVGGLSAQENADRITQELDNAIPDHAGKLFLVSDKQTDRPAANSGRTYQVWYTDENGSEQPYQKPDGGLVRFAPERGVSYIPGKREQVRRDLEGFQKLRDDHAARKKAAENRILGTQ